MVTELMEHRARYVYLTVGTDVALASSVWFSADWRMGFCG